MGGLAKLFGFLTYFPTPFWNWLSEGWIGSGREKSPANRKSTTAGWGSGFCLAGSRNRGKTKWWGFEHPSPTPWSASTPENGPAHGKGKEEQSEQKLPNPALPVEFPTQCGDHQSEERDALVKALSQSEACPESKLRETPNSQGKSYVRGHNVAIV